MCTSATTETLYNDHKGQLAAGIAVQLRRIYKSAALKRGARTRSGNMNVAGSFKAVSKLRVSAPKGAKCNSLGQRPRMESMNFGALKARNRTCLPKIVVIVLRPSSFRAFSA